ncbi:hypothetical protein [Nocardioides baculatus]|uniref:Major facilitator superfamily (MFS) profile domain-containing protein n=1 Tax=Nocardioides baculatus TaxID=2801337 RepID=A0ABS1L3G6_9ACTN|nr:hypothetical protein [Nocardioides baculatus]MBL0746120.1 hypothetical protein [Nocardioides baculatus]
MTTYRPQPLWLLMGPLLGSAAGALVGLVLVVGTFGVGTVSDGTGEMLLALPVLVVVGVLVGGFLGAIAGFFAGLPFVFLVGRHLPRDVARRRAFTLGFAVSPLALLTTFGVINGDASWFVSGWPSVVDSGVGIVLLASSVMGGLMAAKAAGMDDLPEPVS